MQDNYHIRLEKSLRHDEVRCSLRTFLKVAEKLGNIDYKIILDDQLPDDDVVVSESLYDQVVAELHVLIAVD